MKLGTKLRICTVFSVLALVFKIIVFVSPGWVVVMKDIDVEPIESTTGGTTPHHHGMSKTRHPDDLSLSPTRKHVSISFGVWYYKVCMCDKGDDNNGSSEEKHHDKKHHGDNKCFHGSYRHEKPRHDNNDVMEDSHDNIPPEFRPARVFITKSVEIASYGRHALAAFVTIGLVFGVISLIAAIKYAHGGGVGKHSGRVACATQAISSFFFWMAIIRAGTYIFELNILRHYGFVEIGRDFKCAAPWCLVVGALGALIMTFTALFHMILISRDRKYEAGQYTYQVEKGKTPYLQMNEEAGPLPEKPSIA